MHAVDWTVRAGHSGAGDPPLILLWCLTLSVWNELAQEPWIIGLLCSHVVVLISIVLTRNHSNAQACLFVWLSEPRLRSMPPSAPSKRVVHWHACTWRGCCYS